MHLDQHRQPQAPGHLQQIGQIVVGEDRGDQQRGVGAGGPGLIELIGSENEVFAQQRQLHRQPHVGQYVVAPLEEAAVGEHRQAAGATGGVGPGDRHRIEILSQHPLARACLLHLRDHRRLATGRPQRSHKIPAGGEFRHLLAQLLEAHPLARGVHLPVLLPDDFLQDVARLALLMGDAVLQVGHLHGGVGRTAADFHGAWRWR